MLVEIVYTLSGRGLTRDADLLKDTLRSLGHEVSIKALPPQHPLLRDLSGKWGRAKRRLRSPRTIELVNRLQRTVRRLFSINNWNAGLVIHLENIHPHYLNPRCPNWLIPNQEWFRPERIHYLSEIDRVLCKTRVAEQTFSKFHKNVEYLGFSIPGAVGAVAPTPQAKQPCYVHVAGSSLSKGTTAVITAWQRHPEWPMLTIVANSLLVDRDFPDNIKLEKNLPANEMEQLWRQATVAIIPSEVEGYGQVLGEAMLAGAVVVTTDAPPMNELVTTSRGYLVPYREQRPWRLGTRYLVHPDDLERCLVQVLKEPQQTIETKAQEAHRWVIANHKAFVERLSLCIASVETASCRSAGQPD